MGKDVIIALDFDSKEKTLAFLDRFTEEKPFVICEGAITILSPVWMPSGSKFSMLQTVIQLS